MFGYFLKDVLIEVGPTPNDAEAKAIYEGFPSGGTYKKLTFKEVMRYYANRGVE